MKEKIRSSILKKRKNMTFSEVLEKSERIKEKIFHMDEFKDSKTVLFYISYDNEVYTHDMIKESYKLKKLVVVPKIIKNYHKILCSTLTRWDDLFIGSYNILEPRNECFKEISLESIDLIIIPGIAFDCKGNRIGHGKGYYDRFLTKKITAHRLALAFEFQIVDRIPTESHDVKVGKIVTEKRIINCY